MILCFDSLRSTKLLSTKQSVSTKTKGQFEICYNCQQKHIWQICYHINVCLKDDETCFKLLKSQTSGSLIRICGTSATSAAKATPVPWSQTTCFRRGTVCYVKRVFGFSKRLFWIDLKSQSICCGFSNLIELVFQPLQIQWRSIDTFRVGQGTASGDVSLFGLIGIGPSRDSGKGDRPEAKMLLRRCTCLVNVFRNRVLGGFSSNRSS